MAIWPLGGPFHGPDCSKWPFLGPKFLFFGPKSIFCGQPPFVLLPSWRDTKKTTFLCWSCCWTNSWGDTRVRFWPENLIFLRYTHITPHFWAQTDPTRWDHKFPISWGNFGYLQFSGRCPFGCSAGRFMAPIAQNGLFGPKKQFSGPGSIFWGHHPKVFVPSWLDTKKTNKIVFTVLQGGIRGGGGGL